MKAQRSGLGSWACPWARVKARVILSGGLALAVLTIGVQCRAQETTGPGRIGLPEKISAADQIRFEHPSFTFVRIKYSGVRYRSRSTASGAWATDYPDADLNFAIRFQGETGLRVDTNGLVLELTDARLKQYPFIYIVEGGQVDLSADEVQSLREYLLGGGFLLVDDFWGEPEWDHVRAQMTQVFPDRDAVDLPITHPLFHCFYELTEKPQVPNVALGMESLNPNSTNYGQTWERPDAREAHYRGLMDDRGRLMAVFCHNTDLGDGWERANMDAGYYREFSLKRAYPMGINIVVHALSK